MSRMISRRQRRIAQDAVIKDPARASRKWGYEFRDLWQSRDSELHFQAYVRIEWEVLGNLAGGDSRVAVSTWTQLIAEKMAREATVLRREATENAINHDLAIRLPHEEGSVRVLRASVTLDVEEGVLEQARRRLDMRRQLELDNLTRQQSSAQVAFMREEILRDPVNARLHWLLSSPTSKIADEETWLNLVGQASMWSNDSRWVHVARLMEKFLSGLSAENRRDLLGVLKKVFAGYGEEDLAAEIPDEWGLDKE
ncbi:hypothetical protein EYS09_16615 [Streptomyces kasugaensis]|uniref:Uncharacterized protein n=1 Tax=Streptomyces kasugaensis TaxID=1946 RepID=A0A4Q9HUP4_STRKA|nr:hypothetical protein [Streptomyces kasugaensis]TBO58585.1 hypothetical protein EYS09_16615 [Streptomyces kasugaensis]